MSDAAALRQQLVQTLRELGVLTDEAVASAFRSVPREVFLPGLPLEQVYTDEAFVTKQEDDIPLSSSSQPAIMAIMLEQLDVRPGMQVLEIGAGTGYNAALLQWLAGETGRVVSVEIDPEVAAWARERLAAAGYPEVAVIRADGADGYEPLAPYDRIELTVGAADIAPAWVEQLRPGGLLVLPLWFNGAQASVALEKEADRLRSRSVQPCGFMRIRGRLAGPDRFVAPLPGVVAAVNGDEVDPESLRALLRRQPRRETWPGVEPGWPFWAALWSRRTVQITARAPAQVGFTGHRFGYVDAAGLSLCLAEADTAERGATEVLVYGADTARDRLRHSLDRWASLGAPGVTDATLAVYPLDRAPEPGPTDVALDTRWWRFVVGIGDREGDA